MSVNHILPSSWLAVMLAGGLSSYPAFAADSPPSTNRVLEHLNSPYLISDKDLPEVEQQARAGDADAAFRLYLHYDLGRMDSGHEAYSWLTLAASNGNVAAQYNLGYTFIHSANPGVDDEAMGIQWLEKAAAQGCLPAKLVLERLGTIK